MIEKLKIFSEELLLRQKVADAYQENLGDVVKTPIIEDGLTSAWAQYTLTLDDRDAVANALKEANIPSVVYYPKSLSQQSGYSLYPSVSTGLSNSNELPGMVLSLPMHPYLHREEIERICGVILDAI